MGIMAKIGSFMAAGAFLLVAPAAFAQTIGAGSASVEAGGSAAVTVSLSGATGVVGTQNDLSFDADVSILPNANGNCAVTTATSCTSDDNCPDLTAPFSGKEPCVNINAPDCEVAPGIGKGGFFGFLPAGCSGAACTSMRALVLSLTSSADAIPNGPLYTCMVTASATATGNHPLNVSNVRTANSSGQAVCGAAGGPACASSNGSVTIGAAAGCAGDCNGDNEVFGNEVTVAINIVAGNADLATCENADANGDGEVFGNEVTIAINNVANGCPE